MPGHHQSIPDPARLAPVVVALQLCVTQNSDFPRLAGAWCVCPRPPTHSPCPGPCPAPGRGRRRGGWRAGGWAAACWAALCPLVSQVTVLGVDTLVTAAPAAALTCHQPRSSPARPATSLHSASVSATSTTTTSYFYSAVTSTVCLT